jgi:hypothetical protein
MWQRLELGLVLNRRGRIWNWHDVELALYEFVELGGDGLERGRHEFDDI